MIYVQVERWPPDALARDPPHVCNHSFPTEAATTTTTDSYPMPPPTSR